MSIKFSVAVRNARLDAIEATTGPSAILKLRTGAPPALMTDADSGTVLATAPLPADYMAAAAGGSKAKIGTWEDINADAAGTPGHFRIYAADGVTQHMQGTVTAAGGGGDMTIDDITLVANQNVVVTAFTLTDGNG